jgi:hypothetical protein
MQFCLDSFPFEIRDQCGHEKRSQFERNHCIIMCRIYRRYAFEERHVFAFVNDATFAIFRQACVDVVELQAYSEAKSGFQSKVKEMHNELIRVQGATPSSAYCAQYTATGSTSASAFSPSSALGVCVGN